MQQEGQFSGREKPSSDEKKIRYDDERLVQMYMILEDARRSFVKRQRHRIDVRL